MGKLRGFLLALLALGVTSALCLTLYRWDNKYAAPGLQPISGVLFLSEAELAAQPVHYLVREWELYPGVLLTPEEVGYQAGYRRFVDIGGRGNLDRGVGSYRLTLMLPDEAAVYALELPEVYSACRLYVNGVPLLQLGDPETGREGLASRMVTFSASGRTELLLCASNQSAVYGGLTYPPAFGALDEVLARREGRLLLHGGVVLLGLLGAVLACVFGMMGNRRRGLLHGLLCLCVVGVSGYPLLHGLVVTGVWPWYLLEGGCYYALLLLAVLLQCDLYGLWRSRALWLAAPCALGLLCGLCYFGGVAVPVFSLLSAGLKYYAAACLIGLSAWALWRGKAHSAPLLCASTGLAVTLVFDRVAPLYEPIYGGWPGEVGGVLLGGTLAVALWADAVSAYRFRLAYQGERQQLRQRLSLQKEHYRQLSEQVLRSREAAHDLRHHLRLLRSLAERGAPGELLIYLDEYEPHLREREVTVYSDHLVADAILKYYAAEAARVGADYDARLAVPSELPFPDDELCILLSNLLENAMEALARQTEGRRTLYLRGGVKNSQLGLVVDNSFDGVVSMREERYLSTKREGGGIGLASVQSVVEKYGGLADFSVEGTTFRASVMVPLSGTAQPGHTDCDWLGATNR